MSVQYAYKMTSELTELDITDILHVLNSSFQFWGDETDFRWKFLQNPYGDSMHMIGHDEGQAVATVSFWRNDLAESKAYQCVDLGVVPSHQRTGIFREGVTACVERLEGAYMYTYPGAATPSYFGFLKQGWVIQRRAPITLHLSSRLANQYETRGQIPDDYAQWRFVHHPRKQYYVYRKDERVFLLSKLRQFWYAAGGMLSQDFGLPAAQPFFLLSYDFPDHPLVVPKKSGYYLENPRYVAYDGDIPSYRSDTL